MVSGVAFGGSVVSRTIKGAKKKGFEYNGCRPFNSVNPSKEHKRITHQIERAMARKNIHLQVKGVKDEA